MVLFIGSASSVLYSAVSGVKRVSVVLSGFRMRLFVFMYVFPVGMIECLLLLCLCHCYLFGPFCLSNSHCLPDYKSSLLFLIKYNSPLSALTIVLLYFLLIIFIIMLFAFVQYPDVNYSCIVWIILD